VTVAANETHCFFFIVSPQQNVDLRPHPAGAAITIP
jgi:hypothetical protein